MKDEAHIYPIGMVILACLLALGGCGIDDATHRMDMATYQRACTGYGFTPGTPAFAQCMQQQADQRAAENQRAMDRMQLDEEIDRLNKKLR